MTRLVHRSRNVAGTPASYVRARQWDTTLGNGDVMDDRAKPQWSGSIDEAARRMYDAECALHAARTAHVDEWIAAAADRLHSAIAAHLDATPAQAIPRVSGP
jgi:hypothetical protein